MRKIVVLLVPVFILVLSLSFMFEEHSTKALPSVNIKTLNGITVNSKDFNNSGLPFIIALWGSYCPHCHEELANISDVYEEWKEETGLKLIAIAIDDTRTSKKVKSYVNSEGWEFEIYLDENGAFKRAISVNNLPYIAIVDSNRNIVFESFAYYDGAEEELYEKVKELIK